MSLINLIFPFWKETIIEALVGMGFICFVYIIVKALFGTNESEEYDEKTDSCAGRYNKKINKD